MFKIAKLEFKKFPLYWWVPVLIVCCVLFARFTYPMSIEGWDAGRIFELSVIYPESDAEERELERLYDLTREVLHSADASELGQRYRGGVEFLESEGCYTLTDERLSDISPGGGLYEDGSELYLKAERMKVISGSVFELDDDLILAKFYLRSLVSDQSVPFLMSMLLAPLFFGRDLSRRVTGAAVS